MPSYAVPQASFIEEAAISAAHHRYRLAGVALAFAIAACSPKASEAPDVANGATTNQAAPTSSIEARAPATIPSTSSSSATDADTLTLEGLGELRVEQPVPANSSWASRGAQVPGGCRTISSPDYPGARAIVIDRVVRRITIGPSSDATLAEGIGPGASEQAVRRFFPGFREEPHEYVEPPAKYLTSPHADSGEPALRFEIGTDRKVNLIHVGTMPVLGYVEGCV